jgi:hypothetical protein
MDRTAIVKRARRKIRYIAQYEQLVYCQYPGCHALANSPAHRYPMRYYKTAEEMSDKSQWFACCQPHHHYLDHTAEGLKQAEDIFNRVLGIDPYNIKKRK